MSLDAYVFELGQAFVATAARHGERPAVRLAPGRDVRYAELGALTNRLTRWLLSRKVGPGGVVALQNNKTPEGYALMLACLTIGAAYTNLDVQNPPERLARMLAVCRPRLVVCDESPAAVVIEAAHDIPVVALRDHRADIEALDPTLPSDRPSLTGTEPAYVMFTSGSTGVPKGVAIAHASLLNFVAWSRSVFGIGPGDVVANANPLYFDNSVFDFYSALFTGACLAPITSAQLVDAPATAQYVDATRCTVWFSVPSLLIYLMTMKALTRETFRSVRTIVFGGEGYPKSELSKLFALYGERCRFFNVYGPTECTCICSACEVSASDLRDGHGWPPLGRIAPNFSYLLLNGDAPALPGEIGELCLLGPQVGLGYYNDAARTREAFVPNPLSVALPERMYRTGDLVREIDGLLHFVGRKDNQIKHMGYRIELEEIETAIGDLDDVIQTAVLYQRVRDSFGHIVAYIATREAAPDPARLRADLASVLPPYMIPGRFVFLPELPKNPNGKVDRARLRDLVS